MIVAGNSTRGRIWNCHVTERNQAEDEVYGLNAGLSVSIIGILHSARRDAVGVFLVGGWWDERLYRIRGAYLVHAMTILTMQAYNSAAETWG